MIDFGDLKISEVEHIIDERIFSERDRKILKRRLLDNIRLEPLAEEFNLSVTQIKTILNKQKPKIYRYL